MSESVRTSNLFQMSREYAFPNIARLLDRLKYVLLYTNSLIKKKSNQSINPAPIEIMTKLGGRKKKVKRNLSATHVQLTTRDKAASGNLHLDKPSN